MADETATPQVRIEITLKTFWMALGVGLLVWGLFQIREVLVLLFLSLLVASTLYPSVAWLKTKRFPQHLSVLLIYGIFVLVLATVGFFSVNLLLEQGTQLLQNLPTYINRLSQGIHQFLGGAIEQRLVEEASSGLSQVLSQGVQFLFSALDYLLVLVKGILAVLGIFIFTYFLMTDTAYFESLVLALVPKNHQNRTRELLCKVAHGLGTYVRGQFLVMSSVGILVSLGLSFLHVPYAFLLGILAFLLDMIPLIGPFVAGILGVLVTIGNQPDQLLWVILLYIVVQQIENYALAPLIVGRSTGLHPFWILMSLLTGGALFGVVGVLLSVPTAVTVHAVYQALSTPVETAS